MLSINENKTDKLLIGKQFLLLCAWTQEFTVFETADTSVLNLRSIAYQFPFRIVSNKLNKGCI